MLAVVVVVPTVEHMDSVEPVVVDRVAYTLDPVQ
jgi:hypothetical protein